MAPLAGLFSNHGSAIAALWDRSSAEPTPHEDGAAAPLHHATALSRLKPEEVDELVNAFLDGTTVLSLAERFHTHRTTILRHLRRRGVSRLGEWSPELTNEAARRYEGGETLGEIATALRLDPRTVGRHLRQAGVKIRPSGPRRRGSVQHPVDDGESLDSSSTATGLVQDLATRS